MNWYEDEKIVRIKENKVSIKMYNADGSFLRSINIPTIMYPTKDNRVEIFTQDNTYPVQNEKILAAFNNTEYQVGRCYTNTENLIAALHQAGIKAESYCGWLFLYKNQVPTYHCWTVITDGDKKHILDLSADKDLLYPILNTRIKENPGSNAKVLAAEAIAELMKIPNTERCAPVGRTQNETLYIGSPCSPNEGRKTNDYLIKTFPEHPCFQGLNNRRETMTQQLLRMKK